MFAVALFAIPILIADWRSRKIPNIYLIFIAYSVAIMRINSGIESLPVIVLSAAFSCVAAALMRMGIGDVKLFIIIVLALNLERNVDVLSLVSCIYLAVIVQIVLTWCYMRTLPGSVPLAFSIIFGTALYLAASSTPFLQEYADALVNSW